MYAHEVEVCDDVFKLICNIQFCTTCISRAFGSSLCLKVLSVGSSVAAIVPSQLLLSAHLQVLQDWEIPSCVSAAETHAQCSSGTDHRKSISVVAAGNEERVARGLASMETEAGQVLLPSEYFLCARDNALSKGGGFSLDVVASLQYKTLNIHKEQKMRLPDPATDGNSSGFRSVIFDMITRTSRLEVSRERDDGGALLPPRITTRCTARVAMTGPIRWSQDHDDGGPTASQVQRHEGCHRAHGLVDSHLWARRGVQWPAGPQAFYGQLNQAAETFFSTHDQTGTLFAFVYDDVVHETGLPTIGMGSTEHFDMTWQKVKSCPIWSHRGDTVKLGRWQSTFNVAAWWRGQRSSYLLVFLGVGFKKGWWKSIAHLPFQQMGVDVDADPSMPSPGVLGRIASPAASTSSSSSSCVAAFNVAPAVASAASSAPVAVATVASKPSTSGEKLCHTVKQSKADLQQLRHNCNNTMHLSAVVLANRFSFQIMDALTIVCRPMSEVFNLIRTTFKTRMRSSQR